MKKITSILLLFVMLAAGMHLVLAFHFCGGELYAFGMAGNNVEKSCCSAGKRDNTESSKQVAFSLHNSCCDIQQINISTDDYQNQQHQSNLNNLLLSPDHAYLAPESSSNRMLPEIPSFTNNAFPPGGSVPQHIDILTYICIFRI